MADPIKSSIGSYIKALTCGAARVTAAGAGDNSAITGATIDRLGYGSCKFSIGYKTTLTAAQTLSFAAEYQESDDGSSWGSATALQAATVAKTGAQTAAVDVVSFDVDLAMKKRYVRFNFTPDLSAGATDTADVCGIVILGGAETLPAA